jgi:hypothetical protein
MGEAGFEPETKRTFSKWLINFTTLPYKSGISPEKFLKGYSPNLRISLTSEHRVYSFPSIWKRRESNPLFQIELPSGRHPESFTVTKSKFYHSPVMEISFTVETAKQSGLFRNHSLSAGIGICLLDTTPPVKFYSALPLTHFARF